MRIMLAYDGSSRSDVARDLVARLPLPAGSAITMVTALEPSLPPFVGAGFALPTEPSAAADEQLLADLRAMLDEAAGPLRTADRQVEVRIVRGRPASALLDEAIAMRPDLIVAGSRGHGALASMLIGSVSAELVDHAPCPVLVARHPRVERLVVGVDGSPSGDGALALLQRWPLFAGQPTTVVTVSEPSVDWAGPIGPSMYPAWVHARRPAAERRAELEANAARATEQLARAGMAAAFELREGDPAEQLIAAAEVLDADLIVVGSRGLSTIPRLLLGSVARKVLLHAPQSVLVVREPRERVGEPERARSRPVASGVASPA